MSFLSSWNVQSGGVEENDQGNPVDERSDPWGWSFSDLLLSDPRGSPPAAPTTTTTISPNRWSTTTTGGGGGGTVSERFRSSLLQQASLEDADDAPSPPPRVRGNTALDRRLIQGSKRFHENVHAIVHNQESFREFQRMLSRSGEHAAVTNMGLLEQLHELLQGYRRAAAVEAEVWKGKPQGCTTTNTKAAVQQRVIKKQDPSSSNKVVLSRAA